MNNLYLQNTVTENGGMRLAKPEQPFFYNFACQARNHQLLLAFKPRENADLLTLFMTLFVQC